MKKTLLILAVLILCFGESYAQATFSTGAMNVNVSAYGRIRLFTPDGKRHLQRASLLVGTSPTEVFEYTNDANTLDPTALVTTPASSDFEIYGSYNYSGTAPNVIEKLYAYGWTNQAYTIIKFNITNNEATAINATAGLDIIDELNQTYGLDTVTYNATEGVVRFHRGLGVENLGVKLLSASLTSLYSFEWYDGYPDSDADYWNWMNKGTLQPQYISTTADGPVAITAQAPVALEPEASFNVFYALALGADEPAMLANIAAAKLKYEALVTSVKENKPSANGLRNFPNPVKSTTKFSYDLPKDGFVSLKIYDALGNVVATLVNSKQSGGQHTIDFNAKDLSRGIYSYRLVFDDQVKSNKMVIVK